MGDLLTFADLAERDTVTLTVKLGYGRLARVTLAVPSPLVWHEDEHEELDIPVPGASKGEANLYDVTYRKEQAAVAERRRMRHLARALSEGGMDIPGRDLEAKAEALASTNAGLINTLWSALKNAVFGGEATPDADGSFLAALRADQARRAAQVRAVAEGVGGDAGAVEAPAAAGDVAAPAVPDGSGGQDAG